MDKGKNNALCLAVSHLYQLYGGPNSAEGLKTRVYREVQIRAPGEHKSPCPVASAGERTSSPSVCVPGNEMRPLGDHLGRRLRRVRWWWWRRRHLLSHRFRDLCCCLGRSPSARVQGVRPVATEPPELQLRLPLQAQRSERHSHLPPRASFPRSLSAEMQRRKWRPDHSTMEDRGGTANSTDCKRDKPSPLTFRSRIR